MPVDTLVREESEHENLTDHTYTPVRCLPQNIWNYLFLSWDSLLGLELCFPVIDFGHLTLEYPVSDFDFEFLLTLLSINTIFSLIIFWYWSCFYFCCCYCFLGAFPCLTVLRSWNWWRENLRVLSDSCGFWIESSEMSVQTARGAGRLICQFLTRSAEVMHREGQ